MGGIALSCSSVLAAILLVGQVFAGVSEPVVLVDPNNPSDSLITARVEEDNPAWDCRTMGNHICGPINR